MKILLITLNSKFTHTSPALRSLRAMAPNETEILECTVNQPKDEILQQIFEHPADAYGFSVYIFNVAETERILSDLRAVLPDKPIFCGGPEVSYRSEDFLRKNPAVDAVLRGEGEDVYAELVAFLKKAKSPREDLHHASVRGLSCLREGTYVENPLPSPICDLDRLPFPYRPEELVSLRNRILYYESCRGCPYTCIYCLSSVQGRVRARTLETVFEDLQKFLDAKVKLVKFVDRTFNFSRKRTLAIWNYLKEHDNGVTSFHFEVAAWLLSEEEIALLESFRPGMILLEVGIQSTNPHTLEAITRKTDPQRLYEVVRRLSKGPCHVHTDLIAGLPHEDLRSFEASFNTVFGLNSHCLQLGFLKHLSGTALANRNDGAVYSEFPPYEILRNQWLSHEDLAVLKGVEKVLDKYWNSGLCRHLLSYLSDRLPNGIFAFFRCFAEDLRAKGTFYLSHTPSTLFALMAEQIDRQLPDDLRETAHALLCYDLFTFDRCHTVSPWQKILPQRDDLLELLKSDRIRSLLTEEQSKVFAAMNPVQWFRNADLATFPCAPDGTPTEQTHLFLYGPLRIRIPLNLPEKE